MRKGRKYYNMLFLRKTLQNVKFWKTFVSTMRFDDFVSSFMDSFKHIIKEIGEDIDA